ncbi:MAG: hypothetical protein ABH875_04960 [Candidatus Omnitrophota bacterium]
MKYVKMWKLVFAVWVFFWVLFLVRGLVKGEFEMFRKYAFISAEEKREHILGEGLYTFLGVCKSEIPEAATYKLEGEIDDHNKFRMRYYLYPRLESESPDYLLDVSPNSERYLLKRVR